MYGKPENGIVPEQGVEKNIWVQERGSNSRQKNIAK